MSVRRLCAWHRTAVALSKPENKVGEVKACTGMALPGLER